MNPTSIKLHRVLYTTALATFLGGLLLARSQAAPPSASGSVSYAGQASAVIITDSNTIPGGSLTLCDTGPLPSTGGSLQQTITNVNNAAAGLTIDLATAATRGEGPEAVSETALTGLVLELMPPTGGLSTLSCSFAGSEATASVRANGKFDVSASVHVQDLVLNGVTVRVTGRPNQVVDFPGGQIIINEQTSTVTDTSADITVTALHVIEFGCSNGLYGFAHAGITATGAPPPPTEECGKLTGGGWITGTPLGGKGTFGVSGGIRRGEFWGHLEYIDHDTGMKVHSNDVTGFTVDPNDPDCATITYNVTIDGEPGTATVVACDHGEPGRDDTFDITLSNGYHAGGDLGGARPGGGNIQMHKCPPGWAK